MSSIFLHIQPYLQPPLSAFSLRSPFNQFRLHQGTNEQGSLMRNNTVLIYSYYSKVWTGIAALTSTDSL